MLKRLFIIFFTLILFTGCSEFIEEILFELDFDQIGEVKDTKENVDGELEVHFIDVDQGDATLITNENLSILIDAGDWKDEKALQYLKELNIEQIDLAILTHPHSDHIGQMAKIIEQIDVKRIWMSKNEHTSKTYENVLKAILENDIDYEEPESGYEENFDAVHLKVLHPKKLTGDLNKDSLSVKVTFNEVSFIFTGDAYKENEREMIERHNDLQAQILHLGHHGSNTSTSELFLKTVNPDLAIYSAGKDNMYNHPHREVVQRVQREKIKLLGTDKEGTIIIRTNGSSYEIDTVKNSHSKIDFKQRHFQKVS